MIMIRRYPKRLVETISWNVPFGFRSFSELCLSPAQCYEYYSMTGTVQFMLTYISLSLLPAQSLSASVQKRKIRLFLLDKMSRDQWSRTKL